MLGKKPSKSIFTTTCRPACGLALLNVLRPVKKPCGQLGGRRLRMLAQTHFWASARLRCGALRVRVPRSFRHPNCT